VVESYGYLKYDPRYEKLTSKKNIKLTKYKDWWLILKADTELIKYYQWWLNKEATLTIDSRMWLNRAGLRKQDARWPIIQKGIKITSSAWGPHISVIRGEKPLHEEVWNKYDGDKIWFEYNPEFLNTNGKHWWIRIISKDLEAIRIELGLTPQLEYNDCITGVRKVNPFHLTIGHVIR
jgi:hypothetical protein